MWGKGTFSDAKCYCCNLPRGEHHYNGACYGVCGEFTGDKTTMKLLAPTGFARLATAKAALKYAEHRLDEGCDVRITRDVEDMYRGGMYRVEFEPRKEHTHE